LAIFPKLLPFRFGLGRVVLGGKRWSHEVTQSALGGQYTRFCHTSRSRRGSRGANRGGRSRVTCRTS
jgi:hypothetical protein